MNIYFNLFENSVVLFEKSSGKDPDFAFEKSFDYPISKKENVGKVITELMNLKEVEALKTSKSNSLIIGDDVVGFGLFNLPHLSPFKVNDVITTRLKMNFPDYKKYYFSYSLFEKRRDDNSYFYSFANIDVVNNYLDLFEKNGVHISNIDYFANSFIKIVKGTSFPVARLFIGKKRSELVVYKGELVVSVNEIEYGTEDLNNGELYINSAFNRNNEEALKYSAYIKANFATKEVVTDDAILKTNKEEALLFSKPRELRILKDNSLAVYSKKNNIRKFATMIFDLIEFYSSAPWFLPLKEIETYCRDDDLFESLSNFAKDFDYAFIKGDINRFCVYKNEISFNKLFKSKFKTERKKIDWGKLLTMEIGGKKKKA